MNNGWLSEVGNRFISKNFSQTIQNDNLSDVNYFKFIYSKPILEQEHKIYEKTLNKWIIDPLTLCSKIKCVKNHDGSYNFELIIEYYPQRLAYASIIISSIATLLCLVYISFFSFKRNAKKN